MNLRNLFRSHVTMRSVLFMWLLACQVAAAMAQKSATITGTVHDAHGPLAGVNVRIKGTSVGTITGMEGRFSIQASPGQVLQFSFIGYSTHEHPLKESDRELKILLKDDVQTIDEVVVTAIGIKQQKKKLGYATEQVDVQALNQPASVNVGTGLSGQIAGLTVNNPTGLFQAPSFELRGKQPLIVVDGIPISTDLYDISAENIESINVLKGTAAAALYGSRGKDGAILITTKLAKEDGLQVNIGVSSMFTAGFTVFPETQGEFGSGSNGKYEFWDGADGGISDGDMTWGPKLDGRDIRQWNSPIRNLETGEVIPWWGDVAGTIYNDRSKYERVPIPWTAHDNLRDFMGTGIISKLNFSVANKSKKSNINLNGDFAYQKGQTPRTAVYNGGLNFNALFNLTNTVSLTSNLSYNKVYSPNYPRYGYGPRNHMYSIMLWMGDDVDGQALKEHLYRPDADGIRQANYNYAWYNNPYFAKMELTQRHDRNTVNGQLKLVWDILPELSFQARTSARLVGTFEDMEVPKSYMNYGDSRDGDYKIWNNEDLDLNSDVLLSYTKPVSADFGFTLNAGGSSFYRRNKDQFQSSDGLIVPKVYNLGNSKGPLKSTNYLSEKAILSLYGSLNLDLYESLFLTFTGRNDWSSTLSPEHNSYFYPSISASFVPDKYISLPSWWDFIKINGAWAQVSSDLAPYSLSLSYAPDTPYGTLPSVVYPMRKGNKIVLLDPNILPQKTTSLEFGFSSSFLKNRLSFDIAYYRLLDENSIIELPISDASGFSYQQVNGNEYTTRGLELILKSVPVITPDFSWNLSANASYSVTRLTQIYGDQEKFGNLKLGDRQDAIYGQQWEKSASGDLILDAKGMPIRSNYNSLIGNVNPDWRYGLHNTLRYKGFTMDIDMDGAIGGTLISTTIQKLWWGGRHPESVMYRQEEYDQGGKPIYVPEGVNVVSGEVSYDAEGNISSDTRQYRPNTTAVNIQTWAQNYPYKAIVLPSESSKFANTFSRSFLKLRRVALSYDFTKVWDIDPLTGLQVSLYANNVFVLKKMPYLDPDFGASDGGLQDPSARYIGFSVNMKF